MYTSTLDRMQECVTAVLSSNKKTDKVKALADFQDVQELLHFTYNIYLRFHVTSKAIEKATKIIPSFDYADGHIIDLLKALSDSVITGHAAIAAIKGFILRNEEHKDLIYKIINKDLKLGCNINTINKVFPKLIPHFQVSLGEKYKDFVAKVTYDGGWLASHKLDGIRCICIITEGTIKFFTRKGHEIHTLDNLRPAIAKLGVVDMVLDGELCILNPDGSENFNIIQQQWNTKDHTISKPAYQMFDMLTLEEFESGTSTRILSERIAVLNDTIPENDSTLLVLPQIVLTEESLAELQAEFRAKGWEGLIIRKDDIYVGKRSFHILKMKDFYDGEFTVDGVLMGTFPKLNSKTGMIEYVDGLKSVFIDFNGVRVDVGSGLSLDERMRYFESPDKIMGKIITVQYFEATENESGKPSMRFPTLKCIHGDERVN